MITESVPLLTLRGAARSFAGWEALQDIHLTLHRGETLALTGHNGSGKSTLLRILGGLLPLSAGSREFAGDSASIGYMPDRFPKLKFTSSEYLTHMGRIRGFPAAQLKAKIQELHDQFNLKTSKRQDMRHYSKGMLQKVNLMQALLMTPELLLLDEPLAGLDAATQEELIEVLLRLQLEGVTIVAVIHEQHFADALGARVIALEQGKIISDHGSSISSITEQGEEGMLIHCAGRPQSLQALAREVGVLKSEIEGEVGRYLLQSDASNAFLAAALKLSTSIRMVQPFFSKATSVSHSTNMSDTGTQQHFTERSVT